MRGSANIIRLHTKNELDDSLFDLFNTCDTCRIEDNILSAHTNDGTLVLESDLVDIFIYNNLRIVPVGSDLDHISYSTKSAESLKRFLLYISKRWPLLVDSDCESIYRSLVTAKNLMQQRLSTGNAVFFVEDGHFDQYLNILSNEDIALKIDLSGGRVFMVINDRLTLFSPTTLLPSQLGDWITAEIKSICELFDITYHINE